VKEKRQRNNGKRLLWPVFHAREGHCCRWSPSVLGACFCSLDASLSAPPAHSRWKSSLPEWPPVVFGACPHWWYPVNAVIIGTHRHWWWFLVVVGLVLASGSLILASGSFHLRAQLVLSIVSGVPAWLGPKAAAFGTYSIIFGRRAAMGRRH
jgi:hypothetical protein